MEKHNKNTLIELPQFNGLLTLNPEIENNTENKTIDYYKELVSGLHGWLILIDDDFNLRKSYQKKVNELVEKFMSYADRDCELTIKDMFIYVAPAKGMGNDQNGKPVIYVDLLLSNRVAPGKPIKEKLKLNTMGTSGKFPIYVSGLDINDKTITSRYPPDKGLSGLIYSAFTHSLVNAQTRLSDIQKKNLL